MPKSGSLLQDFPKGTDLSVHSQEELDAIALQLNMRPRKRFDFKCPIEVMGEVMQEAMAMRHDAPASIQ
ncbi:hypothetical protein D3C77_386110 [compost metagenome]